MLDFTVVKVVKKWYNYIYFVKGSDLMAEFNKREFGERLRKFRKQKGLSQENLARIIGKNATTIGIL